MLLCKVFCGLVAALCGDLDGVWDESYKEQNVLKRRLFSGQNVRTVMVSNNSSNLPPCIASLNCLSQCFKTVFSA